jgi:hypothetical protein
MNTCSEALIGGPRGLCAHWCHRAWQIACCIQHEIVQKLIGLDFRAQTVKPVSATFSSFIFALQGIDSKVRSDLAGDCSSFSVFPAVCPLGLHLNVLWGKQWKVVCCVRCSCREIATNATFSFVCKPRVLVFCGDAAGKLQTLQVVDSQSRFMLVTV